MSPDTHKQERAALQRQGIDNIGLGRHLSDGWLLTPWIQSQSTDTSAVTVLIVVFVGGAMAGFFGRLLGIPVAACLKLLLEELVVPR